MHEKSPILKAAARERLGSRYAKRVREAGQLPAVVYGHGSKPLAVSLSAVETIPHIESGEKVFRLALPGESAEQVVLLKELQFDYLGDTIVHADFARVDLNERVRTRVHVQLTGDAKGLKLAGAILMNPTAEIIVECRVADIPEMVQVDISELDLNQTITADKVKLPTADMKLLTDSHAVIAQIIEQKEVVEVAEAAVVATEGGAEPEVIGEKERLEKAAAEGKAGAAPAKGAAPAAGAKAAAPAAGAKAPAAKK